MAALYYNPDRLVGPATARLTRREDRSAQLGRGPENLGNRAAANYRFLNGSAVCPDRSSRVTKSRSARDYQNRRIREPFQFSARLSAGGRWIRTLGSARDRLWFRRLRPFLRRLWKSRRKGPITERDAPSRDQELKVRIHLPPAASLQTFGPQRDFGAPSDLSLYPRRADLGWPRQALVRRALLRARSGREPHCEAAEHRVVAGNLVFFERLVLQSADAVCAQLDDPHPPVRPEGVRPTLCSSNEIRIGGPIPIFIDRGCRFETHTDRRPPLVDIGAFVSD